MENVLSGVIIIGVMILALLGLTQGSLAAQAGIMEATRLMQNRLADQARTNLTALSAAISGTDFTWIDIAVKNTGNSKLADFTHWDVILTYTDETSAVHVEWRGTDLPNDLEIAEIIEPNILNPGEEMVIGIHVSSTIKAGATNVATVGTPNGITASTIFTRALP